MKPPNLNKQVRLDQGILERVAQIVENSPFTETDVLRAAIEAGLPRLESGEYNPFAPKSVPPSNLIQMAGAARRR